MNFNTRLVDSSRNPLARELLRSADMDEPPDHALTRLALALGLGSSAIVTTVATSAAATSSLLAGTGAATATTGLSAATGTTAGAGAAASGGIIASSAAMSSVGGATVAAVASPVMGSAATALGMLKAMAVVSLTCGTLSFGGTKLAMSIAGTPVTASMSAIPAHVANNVSKTAVHRTVAGVAADGVAAPPAPPDPHMDDFAAAPELDGQPLGASDGAARQGASDRNVGRQDINTNGVGRLDSPAVVSQSALVPETIPNTNPSDEHRVAAVAAFPNDDEQPTPSASNTVPDKRVAKLAKAPSADSETDLDREVALLDRARGALASGQPLVALQALNAYRKQAHRGTLHAESVVLRVKALLALGQRSAAEREAKPLISAAPQSRHAERLRELLGVPANTP